MRAVVIILLMFLVVPCQARQVAGVDLPGQVTIDGQSLVLNGAGVRSKFFFDIYVGALYLPQRATTSIAVFEQQGPWQVSMHFLYDEVSAEKLVDGWNDGFESNTGEAERGAMAAQIKAFNSLSKTVHRGDVLVIQHLPGRGTRVVLNNIEQGIIPGDGFSRAMLKIWLGEVPADESLKDAMLGME